MPQDTTKTAPTERLEARNSLSIVGAAGTFNIVPQNLTEVIEFAKLMSQSGALVRRAFQGNPGACLALTMTAMRVGMDPFALANKAYLTKAKSSGEEQVAYEAQAVHAIVNTRAPLQRRLEITYTGQGVEKRCHVVGLLKGEGERQFKYDSPPIREIGVKNSPLWTADPEQQLHYYSTRAWARRHVPEVLLGIYTDDEIEAQERHYGPDNARDVTPRPKRSDFGGGNLQIEERPAEEQQEPEKPKPFAVVFDDGSEKEFDNASEASNAFYLALMAASRVSRDAVDGLWESNGALLGALREADRADMVDALHNSYLEILEGFKPKAEPEKAAEPQGTKTDPEFDRRMFAWGSQAVKEVYGAKNMAELAKAEERILSEIKAYREWDAGRSAGLLENIETQRKEMLEAQQKRG